MHVQTRNSYLEPLTVSVENACAAIQTRNWKPISIPFQHLLLLSLCIFRPSINSLLHVIEKNKEKGMHRTVCPNDHLLPYGEKQLMNKIYTHRKTGYRVAMQPRWTKQNSYRLLGDRMAADRRKTHVPSILRYRILHHPGTILSCKRSFYFIIMLIKIKYIEILVLGNRTDTWNDTSLHAFCFLFFCISAYI